MGTQRIEAGVEEGLLAQRIEIGMGEGVVTGAPHVIASSGLGSCVAVALYDPKKRIGGLAHIMLPDSRILNGRHTPYQCSDTAIAALIEEMLDKGASRPDIVAKMVGGARMFSFYDDYSQGVGETIIMSLKHILSREWIPLITWDTGGRRGRSCEFYLASGRLMVMAGEHGPKEI